MRAARINAPDAHRCCRAKMKPSKRNLERGAESYRYYQRYHTNSTRLPINWKRRYQEQEQHCECLIPAHWATARLWYTCVASPYRRGCLALCAIQTDCGCRCCLLATRLLLRRSITINSTRPPPPHLPNSRMYCFVYRESVVHLSDHRFSTLDCMV